MNILNTSTLNGAKPMYVDHMLIQNYLEKTSLNKGAGICYPSEKLYFHVNVFHCPLYMNTDACCDQGAKRKLSNWKNIIVSD